MSGKSLVYRLLNGRGTQLKALGELGVFTRGTGIQKSDFTESGAGCIHYGQIHTHYGTWATETKSFIDREFANRLRKAKAGDLVIATTSEDDDAVAKAVAWLGKEDVAVSTDAYIYRHTLDPKYMSYFFQTELFQSQKKPHITGTKVRRISGDSLAKIQIPVPSPDNPKESLAIQAEIVRILDAFTELTAELAAELTTRIKQYHHYRTQLLQFEGGEVEWKTLGAVTTIKTGQSVNKEMISANPGEYPVINSGREPLGFINEWNTDNDPIGITSRGAGVGSITWKDGKYFRGNLNYAVTINSREQIDARFLYQLLLKMQPEIQALCTLDGIPALNAGNLKKLEVPIPALAEQRRIVAILDKFDALTNSISEGLPREIELRQKQYAYYRDQLLRFPKPEEMAG